MIRVEFNIDYYDETDLEVIIAVARAALQEHDHIRRRRESEARQAAKERGEVRQVNAHGEVAVVSSFDGVGFAPIPGTDTPAAPKPRKARVSKATEAKIKSELKGYVPDLNNAHPEGAGFDEPPPNGELFPATVGGAPLETAVQFAVAGVMAENGAEPVVEMTSEEISAAAFDALREFIGANGGEAAKAVLAEFGAISFGKLPVDKHGELLARLTTEGGAK